MPDVKLSTVKFRTVKEPDFQNVVASQKATGIVLNRGNLQKIKLRLLTSGGVELTRAQMIAAISDIVIKVNGQTFWEVDATFLLDRELYYGVGVLTPNVDGIIMADLTLPLNPSYLERSLTAWGLGNVQSLTIDVTVVSTATLSKIELYSIFDDAPTRNLGDHVRINRLSRTFASTGVQELTDMPITDQDAKGWLAEHIKFATGTLSKLRFRANGLDVEDQLSAKLNEHNLRDSGRIPQSGYFHLDFGRMNDVFGFLPMPANSIFQELTWATAAPNSYSVYLERIYRDTLAPKR